MLEQPQRHRDTEKTQSQPPTSQPRRHEDTKESQRPLDRPARSRPHCGRGPLGRATVPNASVRRSHSTQRPALSESAGLASHVDQNLAFEQARPRRDRRAAGASAGEVRPRRILASGTVGLFTGSRRKPALPPLHSGQSRQRRFRSFVFFVSSWLRRHLALCLCASVVFPVSR